MEGKLKYMETYRNIIEEVRPMGTVVDESVDHDLKWRQLTGGAGYLMNMIVFMIRKATGQSAPLAASNELRGKMREVRNLLAIGMPVPHAFLARRNKNSLLASGVRSLEVEQQGWWEDCIAEVPTDSEHCDNWWWWCRPHPEREHAQDLRPPLGARPASPPTRQAAQPPPRGSSTNPRPLA